MNIKTSLNSVHIRIPKKRLLLIGLFLSWILLSTVIPVPAPPGDGTIGPQ